MLLSILIVNWNTCDLLDACLTSISAHPPKGEYEVIVVDNQSQDDSVSMVKAKHPEVRLILPGRNTGYAAGNNLAFANANGEYLLTLNADTEFMDDSLSRAVDVLARNPQYGCLGIKQIGVYGDVQRSVRGFPSILGIMGELVGLVKLFPNSAFGSYRLPNFDYMSEGPAPQPMGTFLLFRKEALEAIGDAKKPFDEGFPIFFNEVDLLYRLDRAGWPCLYTPDAKVLHYGGESTRLVRKSMIWESHRSLVRYLLKNARNEIQRFAVRLLAPIILSAAFIRAKGYDAGFRP